MDILAKYLEVESNSEEFDKISGVLIQKLLDRKTKENWEKRLKEDYDFARPSQNEGTSKNRRPLILITMLAALAILAYLFIPGSSTTLDSFSKEQIAELSILGDQSVFRKGPAEINENRLKANLAYSNASFEEASNIWTNMRTAGETNDMDLFYLSVALLKQDNGDHSLALSSLNEMKDEQILSEEKNWIKALLFLKMGQQQLAKEQLELIKRNKTFKWKASEKLLDLMK